MRNKAKLPLLNRMTDAPSLPLPTRSPKNTQLPLETVTKSSISTKEERYQRRQRTRKFKSELLKQSESILHQQKLLLSRISKQLKATTPRSSMHPTGEEDLARNGERTLLSRMNSEKVSKKESRNLKWMRKISPGLPEENSFDLCQRASRKRCVCWRCLALTPKSRNDLSLTHRIAPSSQMQSGKTLSQEGRSTWTTSSAEISPPPTTMCAQKPLETSKSLLARLSQPKLSRMEETGRLHGIEPFEQRDMLSLTGSMNLQPTGSTSCPFSPRPTQFSMIESSRSTKPSDDGSDLLGISSCQNMTSSETSRWRTLTPSECPSSPETLETMGTGHATRRGEEERSRRRVTIGTKRDVRTRKRTVDDSTFATGVGNLATKGRSVNNNQSEPVAKRPKYLRGFVWSPSLTDGFFSPTARYTLSDPPLPRPPLEEFETDAMNTIRQHPHLFKATSPIDVDSFERLLASHPNRPFVDSVCVSLREGFWPWAHTQKETYPSTWDNSYRPPKSEVEAEFLRSQRDVEVAAGHYSESFGKDLLPGMYSTPIHAVPKPRSDKLRLINDHSAGEFSLNSMIAREDIAGSRLDTVSDLVKVLLRDRREFGRRPLILFKSDVAMAYRRLILHPLWQVKQIVTVDGERHVDHCTTFGGRGSCRSFTSFMGLVVWIAIFVKSIRDLLSYMDDSFSYDVEGNVAWYGPYQCYYPSKQTKLLELWDEIGLPHEKPKQEYGRQLRITGFMVDPNEMRVTMDDEDKTKLLDRVTSFAHTAPQGTRRSLREFQQLAGWINWALNVFPLLKPGLSNVYDKMSGKSKSHAMIYVSKAVVDDLKWFNGHVESSFGVRIFEATDWSIEEADYTAYGDASALGMGFYLAESSCGFQSELPPNPPKDVIFYFEALTVLAIVENVCSQSWLPKRLVVFSDNSNTVDIFSSLRAKPCYNGILKAAVTLLLRHRIDLRVVHIPGSDNVIADALSRFQNDRALAACPGLSISAFTPPRLTMGSPKK